MSEETTEKSMANRLNQALEVGPATFLSELNKFVPNYFDSATAGYREVVEALSELGLSLTIERKWNGE